jgi:hypothetical protein
MTARALGFASGLTVTGNITTGASQVDLTQFAGDMIGNITAANTSITSLRANVTAANASVTAANAAITTANSAMKTYVDTQVASAVIQASGYGNSVVAAYLPVNSTITSIQANIIAANANIVSTQSNVTAANSAITSLRANITAANANIISLQSNTTYITSNVNGSVFTNNIYLGAGNLIVGNINARGNLIMSGSIAPTLRIVRSVDTDVTSGEIYGNIDFAGEDSTINAGNVRARLSVTAIDPYGATDMKFYTSPYGSPAIGFLSIPAYGQTAFVSGPQFTVNNQGYYGSQAGFTAQQIPEFERTFNNFAPVTNDGSSGLPYITNVYSGAFQRKYGNGMYEMEIGGSFNYSYAGFAGRDTANILLSGYLSTIGGNPLVYTDTSHSDISVSVTALHVSDLFATPKVYKRLRKDIVATISITESTGFWNILDQQLQSPVYNSDATNWAAGAAGTGKVLLQSNATSGYGALYLRLDMPTSAASTSYTAWQWTVKIRTVAVL